MSLSLSLDEPVDDAPKFELAKPAEVVVVEDEQANSLLPPLSDVEKKEAEDKAKGFTKQIVAVPPKSSAFDNYVGEVMSLGGREIEKSAEGPNRMLSRASTSVKGAQKSGNDAQVRVAGDLAELRTMMEDLTPNGAELSPTRKILGFIPGGRKVISYFQKYESAQTQLGAITKSLMTGQDELRKDNAFLKNEKEKQMELATALAQYAHLAKALDANLVAEIESLKNTGETEKASALETDVLFYVRQRHQDLLTQITVSVQAVLAMDLIRRNNIELIKGVDRARTTTLSALRTAVIVSEALTNQKMVLDQIDGLTAVTNKTIAATSAMLKDNTARVHAQASSSGVDPAVLEQAFNDIFETMDAIDTFKKNANESMAQTVNALESQLHRTKPYLEKAQRSEAIQSTTTQGRIGQ